MQQYVVRTLRQDSRVWVPSQPLMVICDPRQVLLCFEVGFLTTKNGRDNPALLASHSSYKAINNMISGKRTKYPTGEAADSKTETAKDQGETRTSSCAAKQGKGQQLMETRQRTSLKIKSEKI